MIQTTHSKLKALHAYLETAIQSPKQGWAPFQQVALSMLEALTDADKKLVNSRKAEQRMVSARVALQAGQLRNATQQVGKLVALLRPQANDYPFQVGTVVNVLRTSHGWHDGALRARIISRVQDASGTWRYTATCILDTDCQDAEDEGHVIEIPHTRDAYC